MHPPRPVADGSRQRELTLSGGSGTPPMRPDDPPLVVHLLSGLEVGGKERVALRLARQGLREGGRHELWLFDTPYRSADIDLDPASVSTSFVPRRPGWDTRFIRMLAGHIRTRRVGVIHDDHRYEAVMRNLSKTGAMVEGLVGVPVGTGLVLDLGEGQLAVGIVNRSEDLMIAIEFETPLVGDGAGGLCTRHRVSPYALAASGMPLAALPPGNYPLSLSDNGKRSKPQFMQVVVAGMGG